MSDNSGYERRLDRLAEERDKLRDQVRDTCARAERAEFLLAIMAACCGERIGHIMSLVWPGPITGQDGRTYDGTDKIKAARHDMIRNLFR